MSVPGELDPSRTLYSVRVRIGPDVKHYDMYFDEEGVWLLYLGEYWEGFRPRTLLQQRMDMFIYSIRKKRRRTTAEKRPEDIFIRYEEIKEFTIERKGETRRREERSQRRQETAEGDVCIITFKLKSGKLVEVLVPSKLYKLAKKMLKTYVEPKLLEQGIRQPEDEGPISRGQSCDEGSTG